MTEYASPVATLLTLGKPTLDEDEWLDYPAQGLDETHIPELIALAIDSELHFRDEDVPEIWGPIHALRALGQLRAVAAIEPLLLLLESMLDSDWVREDLPRVYALLGTGAIGPLAAYLEQTGHGEWARIMVGQCLQNIAEQHPEVRDQCVATLTERLKQSNEDEVEINAFLIDYLVNLHAVESLPVIRAAFEADAVEIFVTGDLEDVEIELGVRTERSTPRPRLRLFDSDDEEDRAEDEDEDEESDYDDGYEPPPPLTPEEKAALQKAKAKTKAKRKAAKQSRKKNLKKKKK